MNLITATPHAGRTSHIYVADTDDVSLCGRAPHTFITSEPGVNAIGCATCLRAYNVLLQYFTQTRYVGDNNDSTAEILHKKKGAKKTKRVVSLSSSRRTPMKSTTKRKLLSHSKAQTRKGITS